MAHPHARLGPITRAELVRQVAAGWSQAEVVRQFRVSRPTVAQAGAALPCREAGGAAGSPSVPAHSPRRTLAAATDRTPSPPPLSGTASATA